MGKRQFKAETKQLLDLMINAIYTHREIFLRELISNASDAIDKIKFRSLTDNAVLEGEGDFKIRIDVDKQARTVTITDNGIGMTQEEVIENIGTIAKSGSKEFFEKISAEKTSENALSLIGQFGVGFYSSFMVADKVTLFTKAPGESKGVKWESAGDGNYTIDEFELKSRGTKIVLHLRDDIEEKTDKNFLDPYTIEELVKTYSDYIRYPIQMDFVEEKPEEKDKDGKVTKEKEIVTETRTLNSMTPIWQRSRGDVKEEEYKDFYHHAFHAWDEPLDTIHTKGEGAIEYTALVYIPTQAPFDFYSMHFERGLKLYCRQVFIMEKCKELVPEYLGFIRGLVDSPDFSLNISREVLQHDRQLKLIAKNVEKKVLDALKYLLENNREKYEKFWKEFGRAIKSGVYAKFGQDKEKLQDLLLFSSSHSDKQTTLKEYVSRMKEGQKDIYFAAGRDRTAVESMPQLELFREKGIEVLYFIDKIDEFTAVTLNSYDNKPFKSIAAGDADLSSVSGESADSLKEKQTESKDLLETIKTHLEGRVSEVRLSARLKNSPVCIVAGEGGVSLNMEQVFAEASPSEMAAPKAKRVLEINPNHRMFELLKRIHSGDPHAERLKDYSSVLYNQALLLEGLPLDNPADFAQKLTRLLVDDETGAAS